MTDVIRRGTIYVPKGIGKGKDWSWEDFAIHALDMEKGKFPPVWDIDGTLDFLERYNGTGYRRFHPEVKTPYLYSGTQFYTKGKYTEKRNWRGQMKSYFDKNLVSKQVGCVPILRTLGFKGV
jgi:lysozyme family protein